MLGPHLFQALKNDQTVGQHYSFHLFLHFEFFYTRPGRYNKRMLTKGYSVLSTGLFMDSKLQTDMPKKRLT